jgi:hypothetical protein
MLLSKNTVAEPAVEGWDKEKTKEYRRKAVEKLANLIKSKDG